MRCPYCNESLAVVLGRGGRTSRLECLNEDAHPTQKPYVLRGARLERRMQEEAARSRSAKARRMEP